MSEYEFSGQKEGEKVILVVRQCPWSFTKPALFAILIIILYLATFYFFKTGPVILYSTITFFVTIIYLISRTWFMWWNQVYLTTSDRVIAVDQNGWFTRSMSESNLENILFINHEIKGPLRTLFNFGDVRIRASGVVEDELVFSNVFNPYEVQQEIVKAQKAKTNNISIKHEADERESKVVLR